MSFEDFEGAEVIVDMDSNTFVIERDGKAQSYDLDEEAEFFSRIVNSRDIDVLIWNEGEYEVYSQRV